MIYRLHLIGQIDVVKHIGWLVRTNESAEWICNMAMKRMHPIPQCCTFWESVPPSESIPSIPGILELGQIWLRPIPESILPIPGIPELCRRWIPSNSGITISETNFYLSVQFIRFNSGTEFRELSQDGIGRNSWQFLGIPSNSYQFPFDRIPWISSRNHFLPLPSCTLIFVALEKLYLSAIIRDFHITIYNER